MIDLFTQGGPIMWPLLACSLLAVTLVIERLLFVLQEIRRSRHADVDQILAATEAGQWELAGQTARASADPVARVLDEGLRHRASGSLLPSLRRGAESLLQAQARGIATLDTIITAAPLLGLLGTVTGMIRAFSIVGGSELEAPTAITGGIAEALIATSFGLGIAIVSLFPFNYLNTRLERFRHRLQDACTALEIAAMRASSREP